MVAGMFGLFFMGTLYLQRVLGYDPLKIGFAFLPSTLVMGTMSLRYSERLIMRFGARRTLLSGMVLIAVGLAAFARVPVDGVYMRDVFGVMLVLGFGIGVAFPALMTLAMSGVKPEEAGLASGLVNTTAQVGGALGLAVLATVSATRSDHLKAAGEATASALTGGYHLAWLIGSALVVAAFIVAVTVIQPEPAQAEAAPEADPRGAEPASEAA
jgi:MFS family permease